MSLTEKLNKMNNIDNPTINVYTKKVYAGHYEVSVVCEETNEEFKYTETDMDLIDALENEYGNEWFTQFEAMQAAIAKASNGKY
jgi:hypothetical protein